MQATTLGLKMIAPPLSQSRYELLACPASYVAQVIQGQKEPPNPFSMRGTLVHEKLRTYVDYLVNTRLEKDEAAFDVLIADVTGEARDILNRQRGLTVNPERVVGTEMHLALDDEFRPLDLEHVHDRELCFDEDGVLMCTLLNIPAYEGTLDLVEAPDAETIEIEDYKSYWAIVDADTYQSRHYPLLVFQHFPDVQVVKFNLNFVRFGVSRSVEYIRDRDLPRLTEEARAARLRQLALHDAFVRQESVDAMPNPGCVYCPMLTDGCPIADVNPYTQQSPEDIGKFVMWAEQARKKANGLLKDFVMARGPLQIVDGNGVKYEAKFNLTEKAQYPAECLDVVQLVDPPLAKKLMLSGLSSPLKAKKREVLRDALEQFKVITPGSRFGFKELVAEEEDGDE